MTRSSSMKCACGILTITMVGVACGDSTREVEGYKCADFVKSEVFYGRPVADRIAEIKTYPIEKQYAVFICAVRYIRPPALDATQPFAERGKGAAEFLSTQLKAEQSDPTIAEIVALVDRMDSLKLYAVGEDRYLMDALESAVSRMREGLLKEESKKRLERIDKAEQ